MSIKEFIQQEVLLPRLKASSGVLVVYDPNRRYRELCLELKTDAVAVVDASESSIESREAALATLRAMAETGTELDGMLVYVPAELPLTDENKQRDPFAIYSTIGAAFPEGDGDAYRSLCLKARPDQATEIRRVFSENPNPEFEVIDAIGGAGGWPNLQATLGGSSARELLFGLLAPDDDKEAKLNEREDWISEARDLLNSCLGLKLKTRSKKWRPISDELWRFLLFSEFVFDLPETLPASLADVPCAQPEAQPLVYDLCDRLRNDRRRQHVYIERAEAIEQELDLPARCEHITDLGVRESFPFEERSIFQQAIEAIDKDDNDRVRQLLERHATSVWNGQGEASAQWLLLQNAVSLIEACGDAERQLADHAQSQDALIGFYVSSLREVDRCQREFEQAAVGYIDVKGVMRTVISRAHDAYRTLIAEVQSVFIKHLETSGWPPTGMLANADVFDKLVAPRLKESGRRVAYLLIDALRYELGVALHKQLIEDGQVEIQAAFAQLPTVTPVGMASLLPGAGSDLRITRQNDRAIPMLGEATLKNVNDRMNVLKSRFGQRFTQATLSDFIKPKFKLDDGVELFVIRSSEMDEHLETSPETTLDLIGPSLKRIRAAIHKLGEMGFDEAFIVTDHGFVLNAHAEAGDLGHKPLGNWLTLHDRFLLGDGTANASNFVLPAGLLGIRGDFNQVAGPRGMVAYRDGLLYFHGGASLQEAVVPVITVKLKTDTDGGPKKFAFNLQYRRGAKKITTRLPVIELSAAASSLFSHGSDVEVLIEAHDRKGNVIGEARPGGPVNAATGTVALTPGEPIRVTIKMDMDFEGKFTVKALDPATLSTFATLDLETDYTV
jgi:hypothetical protein